MSIAIIDYGMGNLRSVQKAFEESGAKVQVTASADAIRKADKIVLPGVGAFTAAVQEIKKRKLTDVIREKIKSGAPYLGICLGLQLLFDESEENKGKSKVAGLGIIKGKVKRFRGDLKIPHMGWNTIQMRKKNCPLFKGIKNNDYFYFVHSYYAAPADSSVNLTETSYGKDFCSGIWKDNIFATQFHPEKSQASGLRVIKNFVKL